MQSYWGWHQNSSSPCRCSQPGSSDCLGAHSWQWCGHSGPTLVCITGSIWVVGVPWQWEEDTWHFDSHPLCPVGTIYMPGFTTFPCHHRLWHCVTLPGMWQEDSLVCLAKHLWPDRHTDSPNKSSSRTQPAIAIHADTRALCCTHVQQRPQPLLYMSTTKPSEG